MTWVAATRAGGHHRAPSGQVFVRLIRHDDIWGTIDPRYAAPDRIIRCSRCGQLAVQIDGEWPLANGGTLCREHAREGNGTGEQTGAVVIGVR